MPDPLASPGHRAKVQLHSSRIQQGLHLPKNFQIEDVYVQVDPKIVWCVVSSPELPEVAEYAELPIMSKNVDGSWSVTTLNPMTGAPGEWRYR